MQIYGKKTCANCRRSFFLKTYKRLFKTKRCKDVLRPVFQDALLTNCRSQLKNFQRSEAQTFVSKQPESLSFVMKLECFVDREVVFFEKLESFAEFSVCSQLVSTVLFWCLKLKLRWFLQWLSYLAKFLQSLNLASATRHIQNALQGISRVFWMLRPELLNIVMLIHFVVVWYAKFTCLHLTHWTQICRFLEVLWVAQTSEGSKGPRFEVDPSSKWVRARQEGPWSGLVKTQTLQFATILIHSPEKNDVKVDPGSSGRSLRALGDRYKHDGSEKGEKGRVKGGKSGKGKGSNGANGKGYGSNGYESSGGLALARTLFNHQVPQVWL